LSSVRTLRLALVAIAMAGACQWVSVPSGALVQCEPDGKCLTAGYVCQSDNFCHPPGDGGSNTNPDSGVPVDGGNPGVCNATTCANGCCVGTVCVSSPSASLCGAQGATCVTCGATSDSCIAGACACGAKGPCAVTGQTCQTGACACPSGQTLCAAKTACIPSGGCCTVGDCAPPGPCQTVPVECRAGVCAYSNKVNGTACGTGMQCLSGQCTEFLYYPSNFDPGSVGTPSAAINLSCGISTFDSGTGAFLNWCGQPQPVPKVVTLANGQQAIVLPVAGLTVSTGATLQLTGPLPVIFAVFDTATISGTVRASSSTDGGWVGAGSGSPTCQTQQGGPGVGVYDGGPVNNGAGGGGGGFGSGGGTGGVGAANGANGGQGGNQAPTPPLQTLVPLQGGCAGGIGGASDLGPGGSGGAGGGAIQISAAKDLTIGGTITSSGAGGQGGAEHAGGGGGGSGGGVLLEADTLVISGIITANGGGGGGGGGWDAGVGLPGNDGPETTNMNANGGLGGGAPCGNGGPGGCCNGFPQGGAQGWNVTGGGGGGGGSSGFIRLNSTSSCSTGGSTISPNPQTNGHGC
jgi:hypothetical protein